MNPSFAMEMEPKNGTLERSTVVASLMRLESLKGPKSAANAPENFLDLAGFWKMACTLFLPIEPLTTTVTIPPLMSWNSPVTAILVIEEEGRGMCTIFPVRLLIIF